MVRKRRRNTFKLVNKNEFHEEELFIMWEHSPPDCTDRMVLVLRSDRLLTSTGTHESRTGFCLSPEQKEKLRKALEK
jgi:hypothetical protein